MTLMQRVISRVCPPDCVTWSIRLKRGSPSASKTVRSFLRPARSKIFVQIALSSGLAARIKPPLLGCATRARPICFPVLLVFPEPLRPNTQQPPFSMCLTVTGSPLAHCHITASRGCTFRRNMAVLSVECH